MLVQPGGFKTILQLLENTNSPRSHVEEMLKHARELVCDYDRQRGRTRAHLPKIQWSKWLSFGGGDEEALPASGRKNKRRAQSKNRRKVGGTGSKQDLLGQGADLEKNNPSLPKQKITIMASHDRDKNEKAHVKLDPILKMRGKLADCLDYAMDSDDLSYALKLTVAIFLVLWPGFVSSWNRWFSLNRGLWAALQMIFVLEVSIGTSVQQYLIRLVAVTLGCLWGWAAVEARGGNRIVCVAMIFVGQLPFIYVQLATKYPKGGAVGIVSMCIVSLASLLDTVPGEFTSTPPVRST